MKITSLLLLAVALSACGSARSPLVPNHKSDLGWDRGDVWPDGECAPLNRLPPATGSCPAGMVAIWEDQDCRLISIGAQAPTWVDDDGWLWDMDVRSATIKPWDGGEAPFKDLLFPLYRTPRACEIEALADAAVLGANLTPGKVYAIFGQAKHSALRFGAPALTLQSDFRWKHRSDGACVLADTNPRLTAYLGTDFAVTDAGLLPHFKGPLSLVCRRPH